MWNWPLAPLLRRAGNQVVREMPSHTRPSNPEAGSESSDPPRRPLTITRRNGTNGFNGCHGDSEGLRKLGRRGQGYGGRHAAAPDASQVETGSAPEGRSGRRQMRLAAMPAAELQETGRIPPNAHHSMPEDGCRPCSGLDPPIGMSPVRGCPSLLFLFFAVPSPRDKGAKGKSRGEGRPAARRGS